MFMNECIKGKSIGRGLFQEGGAMLLHYLVSIKIKRIGKKCYSKKNLFQAIT